MKQFIAYCGLDCEICEARIATVKGDAALRQKVAEDWSRLNGVAITPEMVLCEGCRMGGAKSAYCGSLCHIRRCATGRQVNTCSDCPEMDTCGKLAAITGNNPDALRNLKE